MESPLFSSPCYAGNGRIFVCTWDTGIRGRAAVLSARLIPIVCGQSDTAIVVFGNRISGRVTPKECRMCAFVTHTHSVGPLWGRRWEAINQIVNMLFLI